MNRKFLIAAAASGILCVGFGAFGAHGLKLLLPPEQLSVFETGVRYQFYHTIALLAVSVLLLKNENNLLKWAGYAFITGIIFFSGSLYLLATRSLFGAEMTWLGPITPVGGLFFILGWLMILLYALKNKS